MGVCVGQHDHVRRRRRLQTTVPLGIGTLISNGGVLSQHCYPDPEDAYIAVSGAPPSASPSWLSQVRVAPSSADEDVISSAGGSRAEDSEARPQVAGALVRRLRRLAAGPGGDRRHPRPRRAVLSSRPIVTSALAAVQGYVNNDVQAVFFGPGDDIMHQTMECVFMGPCSKASYWPGASRPGRPARGPPRQQRGPLAPGDGAVAPVPRGARPAAVFDSKGLTK